MTLLHEYWFWAILFEIYIKFSSYLTKMAKGTAFPIMFMVYSQLQQWKFKFDILWTVLESKMQFEWLDFIICIQPASCFQVGPKRKALFWNCLISGYARDGKWLISLAGWELAFCLKHNVCWTCIPYLALYMTQNNVTRTRRFWVRLILVLWRLMCYYNNYFRCVSVPATPHLITLLFCKKYWTENFSS